MVQGKRKLSWVVLTGVVSICAVALALDRGHSEQGQFNGASNTAATTQIDGTARDPRSSLLLDFLPAQRNPGLSQIIALPMALRMNGFIPAEITRPKGDFLISVTNLTGLPDIGVRLARETGEVVHRGKVPKQSRTLRQNVHLSPGNYLLTVIDHPEWSCRLTITAQ